MIDFFRLTLVLLLAWVIITPQLYGQHLKAGIIPSDGSRMGLAQLGQSVFGDQTYHFAELPNVINATHFVAGNFGKGVRVHMLAEGSLYAASPIKGEPNSQEEALIVKGFRRVALDPFVIFSGQPIKVGLFVKTITAVEIKSRLLECNSLVIFFFSGASLPSNTSAAQLTSSFDSSYKKDLRLWQGCPSIALTGKRFWTAWFSGGRHEPDKGNYGIVCYSDNGVTNWVDPAIIIKHPHDQVRVMDPQLWTDPSGRLWLFWVQNSGNHEFDGLWGTWASVCTNPEAKKPKWSIPKRLCDGLTRNKPTVLSSGEWLLPSYDWVVRQSTVYLSRDQGKTWTFQGGPFNNDITFYEHMIVERKDKSIWMLQRNIKESISSDKGKTWSPLAEVKELPSPSSRLFISRLRSGNLLLVYNDDPQKRDRKNMTAKISTDDGKSWPYQLLLDERSGISYPDAIEDKNGFIYVVYDRSRAGEKEILMAKFTEGDVRAGNFKNEKSKSKFLLSKPDPK